MDKRPIFSALRQDLNFNNIKFEGQDRYSTYLSSVKPKNIWLMLVMDKIDSAPANYDKNEAAFEQLFNKHFRELHAYAFSIVKDWDIAEEIVQGLFLKLWEKNDWRHIDTSIRSYLYKSVYYVSLNTIRRQKIHLKYEGSVMHTMKNYIDDTAGKLNLGELDRQLQLALGKLPEKCRAIFFLSRFEDLKYQEIADQLNISIKTVETHMGKALRILRVELKEFLPILFLMLLNIFRK